MMKPSDYPNQILKTLIALYDKGPGRFHPGKAEFWPELTELAKMACITTEEEMKKARAGQINPDELEARVEYPFYELEKRKYLEIISVGNVKVIFPTPSGIDHGHFLMRSWCYRKVWYNYKSHVTNMFFTILAAVIISVLTTTILFRSCSPSMLAGPR